MQASVQLFVPIFVRWQNYRGQNIGTSWAYNTGGLTTLPSLFFEMSIYLSCCFFLCINNSQMVQNKSMIIILAQGEKFSVTQILAKELQRQFSWFFFSFWISFWFMQNIYHIYWLKKIALFFIICIVLMLVQDDLNGPCNGIRMRLKKAFATCMWPIFNLLHWGVGVRS